MESISDKSFIVDVEEINYLKKEYNYHTTLQLFSKKIDELLEYEKAQKIDDNFLQENLKKNIIEDDKNKPTLFHYLCYYACCNTIKNIYNLFSDKNIFKLLLNSMDEIKTTPIIYVITGHYPSNTDETLINKRLELINFLCSKDIGIINKTDNKHYIAIDYCFEGLLFNEKYLRYFEVNLNEENIKKNKKGAIKMVTENFITSTQYMYKIFECLLSKYDVSKFTLFLSKFKIIYESKKNNGYDNTIIIKDITFNFENNKFYNKVVIKLQELIKKAEEEAKKNAQELEEEEEEESKKKGEEVTKPVKKKKKVKTKTNGKEAYIKKLIDVLIYKIELEILKKINILDVKVDELVDELDDDTDTDADTDADTDENIEEFSFAKLKKLIKNKDNKLTSLVDNTSELLKSLIKTSKQLEELIDDTLIDDTKDTKLKKLKELKELIEKKKQLEKLIDDTKLKELKELEKLIEKKLEELKLKKEIEKLIETKINSITGLKKNIIELKKKNADSGKSITKISFTRRKSAKLKSLKIKRRKSVKLKSLKRRKSVKLKSLKRRKSVKSKSSKIKRRNRLNQNL